MAYQSILIIFSDDKQVAPVLEAALPLVRAEGGHLDVLCLGIDRTQMGYYYAGTTALMVEDTMAISQGALDEVERAVRGRLEQTEVPWALETVVTQSNLVSELVARKSRFSDLVILPKPYGPDLPNDAPMLVEAALFQGHAPVLVLPDGDSLTTPPKRIVIAWNESPQALYAIRAALPLLKSADMVNILVIDPIRHGEHTADPGSELSKMLARHGVTVEISIVAQTMNRVSDVICRHVTDQSADLLVMGAYGHSRFREAILGGATRHMLQMAEIPVFMKH
jgi:nucleotide-binding universal stress UspA family protein